MSIVVRFKPTNLTKERYDEHVRQLEQAGQWPADGVEYHVAFVGPDGNLLVSEIWDSVEQLEAFGEVLMPVLLNDGIEFSGDPEIFEAHDTYRR